MKKRGQMKLSFGMIFSIFLVIAFLVFGFYAISSFLSLQKEVQIKKFTENFQEEVDQLWKSTQGSQPLEYTLPDKVKEICFYDEEENLEIKYFKGFETKRIEHLDIENTIPSGRSKFCIPNKDNKIKLVLEKEYGSPLVKVKI